MTFTIRTVPPPQFEQAAPLRYASGRYDADGKWFLETRDTDGQFRRTVQQPAASSRKRRAS
jgi:hypothetical protein